MATIVGLIASPLRICWEIFRFSIPLISQVMTRLFHRLSMEDAVALLERYEEDGFASFSPYLDHRRYSLARSISMALYDALNGCGWLCEAVWDAPLSVLRVLKPRLDTSYEVGILL